MGKKKSCDHLNHPFKKITAGKLLFFFCLLISLHGYGQSYFYFENKLSDHAGNPLNYFMFLTVETNGSATGRIHYVEPVSGEDRLIEQKFIDSSGSDSPDVNSPEKKYLVPAGDPYFITGTEDSTLVLPVFIFRKQVDRQDALYVPESVEYKAAGGKWATAEMITQQQKSYSELAKDKDFVSRFFNKRDAFYNYLFTLDTRALTKLERNVKLWLVIVANTNDPTIGITTQKDVDKITETFTTLKDQLGITMVIRTIKGNKFGKSAVEAAINTLRPAPIDIVVFYYSGHGFRYSNDTSKYSRLSLRTNPDQDIDKNNLSIEDIYKRILKKGARVNIVLSDCCNNDIGSNSPVGKNILRTRSVPGKLNFDHAKALFFPDHPVSVLSCAAEKNQLSSGNPALGGFYTNFVNAQLINSLYSGAGESSWLRILLNAKEDTRKQALTAVCDDGRCVQRAEISVVPLL